jgi:hypothetical protein
VAPASSRWTERLRRERRTATAAMPARRLSLTICRGTPRQVFTDEVPRLLALPDNRKRCDGSTLRNAMKIGPPVVLEEGRQRDGSGVGI